MFSTEEYTRAGNNIRDAFVAFAKNHGFDLQAVCNRVNNEGKYGRGFSFSNVSKWLPAKLQTVAKAGSNKSVVPITGQLLLNKLFSYLNICLREGGYMLVSASDKEISRLSSPIDIPFINAGTNTLYTLPIKKKGGPGEDIATAEKDLPFTEKFFLYFALPALDITDPPKIKKAKLYFQSRNKAHLFYDESDIHLKGDFSTTGNFIVVRVDDKVNYWQIILDRNRENYISLGTYSANDEYSKMPISGSVAAVSYLDYKPEKQKNIEDTLKPILEGLKNDMKYNNYIISREHGEDGKKETVASFSSFQIVIR